MGHVEVAGGVRPAVRIQADLPRLAAKGLGLEDLRTAIAAANTATPKGSLNGPQTGYAISANDQLRSAAAYGGIVVAYRDGAPVKLMDVAHIEDGLENDKVAAWYRGMPADVVDVQRQP